MRLFVLKDNHIRNLGYNVRARTVSRLAVACCYVNTAYRVVSEEIRDLQRRIPVCHTAWDFLRWELCCR